MRRLGLILTSVCLFVAAYTGTHAVAQDSVLGKGLTPYGAELSGNDAGTIPSWDGGLTADKMPPLQSQLENPFPNEKPLFVITAANHEQYAEHLSTGQRALLERYPDSYRIPVYPSHRTAAAPQWVYDNVARNHKQSRLVNDGNGIEQASGGIPFPVPSVSV